MNFEVDKDGFLPYDPEDEMYDYRLRDADLLLDMLNVLAQVVGPVVWSPTSQAWVREADYYAETDDGTDDGTDFGTDDGSADDTPPPTTPPTDYYAETDAETDDGTDDGSEDDTPPPTTPPPEQVHDSVQTPPTDEKTPCTLHPE